MHAVVVESTLPNFEGAMTFLREEVLPMVSQAPGLVAGYWVRTAVDKGMSLVVFESEEAARAMADQVVAPPSGAATLDSLDIGEVVAHA
jgi:hypothetical protein